MASNQRLLNFEIWYKTPEDRKKVVFKETIILKQFCADLQRCLKTLYEDKNQPIKVTPDVTKIFKKLNYENWQHKQIEKFYLHPLKVNLTKLKLRLAKLFSQGIDYWKLPLSTNEDLLQDVRDLIKAELIADNLMETLEKRD